MHNSREKQIKNYVETVLPFYEHHNSPVSNKHTSRPMRFVKTITRKDHISDTRFSISDRPIYQTMVQTNARFYHHPGDLTLSIPSISSSSIVSCWFLPYRDPGCISLCSYLFSKALNQTIFSTSITT